MSETKKTVVIAVDESETAAEAIGFYLRSVHHPGYRIVFVNVTEDDAPVSFALRGHGHVTPEWIQVQRQRAEQATHALKEKCLARVVDVECTAKFRSELGHPAGHQICVVAKEENAEMIVTGARGMGKFRRTLLGSVSDFIVHHAHCPVIVCTKEHQRRKSSSGSAPAAE